MESSQICTFCQSPSLQVEASNGSLVCTVCGHILAESSIVSEINFQENASGTASVVGQFVAASGPRTFSSGGRGMPMGHSRASREITLQMAKARIAGIASQLNILPSVSEAAHSVYHLAAQHNFTSGRRQNTVYAACLYVSCRRYKTSHMLIDFAQFLNANVFVLGGAVLKLRQTLKMDLPIIDPSLYMHRFAGEMELGKHAFAVANTALRLLAHMRRDWLQTGRRPSGICGACLLLAARMHNFSRTSKEIAQVVRIGEGVLRQRLGEFSNSSSVSMTVASLEDIEILDDPTQMEAEGVALAPPSFQRLQIRAEKVRRLRQLLETTPDLKTLLAPQDSNLSSPNADINVDDHSDQALDQMVKQIDRAFKSSPELDEIFQELEAANKTGQTASLEPKAPTEKDLEKTNQLIEADDKSTALQAPQNSSTILTNRGSILQSVFGTNITNDHLVSLLEEKLTIKAPRSQLVAIQRRKNELKKIKNKNRKKSGGDVDSIDDGGNSDYEDEATLNESLLSENLITMSTLSTSLELTEEEANEQVKYEHRRAVEKAIREMELYAAELDKDTLSDVDDEECDELILSPQEAEQKERLWLHINNDYLQQQQEKMRMDEEQIQSGMIRPRAKRDRRNPIDVLQEKSEKKITDKINFDAMKNLFSLDSSLAASIFNDNDGSNIFGNNKNSLLSSSQEKLLEGAVDEAVLQIKAEANLTTTQIEPTRSPIKRTISSTEYINSQMSSLQSQQFELPDLTQLTQDPVSSSFSMLESTTSTSTLSAKSQVSEIQDQTQQSPKRLKLDVLSSSLLQKENENDESSMTAPVCKVENIETPVPASNTQPTRSSFLSNFSNKLSSKSKPAPGPKFNIRKR